MLTDPADARHGTANGYSNHKCRCARCKQAWAEYHWRGGYQTRYNRSRGVRPKDEYIASVKHHGVARYKSGCRCPLCCEASADAKRRYRAAHPEYREQENAKRRARAKRDRASVHSSVEGGDK